MARVFRCAYSGSLGGATIVNTFHVVGRSGIAEGEASADGVRDALNTALTTKYRAVCPSQMTVDALTVREETPPGSTDVPAESVLSIGLAGTRSGADDRIPRALCMIAAFKTNAAVRGASGRMWLPPSLNSGDLAGELWSSGSTYWSAVGTFLDELKADHTTTPPGGGTAHLSQVVYSRTRRARGAADWYFDVTGYIRRTAPHFLRSRVTAP